MEHVTPRGVGTSVGLPGHSGRRGGGSNWKLRLEKEVVGEKSRAFSVVVVAWHVTTVQDKKAKYVCVCVCK